MRLGSYRRRRAARLAMAAAVVLAASGVLVACGAPSTPCGQFSLAHSPRDQGVRVTITFTVDSTACGAPPISTDRVVFIQMIRIQQMTTGRFWGTGGLAGVHDEQDDRTIAGQADSRFNGWAIDREYGKRWGYYGRNDDGSYAETVTPGSHLTPAVMTDDPFGFEPRSWFEAVTVAVCVDGTGSCRDAILGYYYWTFVVGANGTISAPGHDIARQWHRDAFDIAIREWNNDAIMLGKEPFPALSRLP